jgi:nucleoside-diphosphate-sugar epimerase
MSSRRRPGTPGWHRPHRSSRCGQQHPCPAAQAVIDRDDIDPGEQPGQWRLRPVPPRQTRAIAYSARQVRQDLASAAGTFAGIIDAHSDYYGPRGTGSTAGETLFGRILAGKKPPWTGKPDQPHTFCFLPDIARGLLLLADRPAADGQIWHLPAAEPLTAQQFFDMVAEAAGKPVPVQARVAGPALLAVAGIFSPLLREMRETTYQFRAPFVIDSGKFEAAFGRLEPTPHRDAVKQTLAWYRSRRPAGQPDEGEPAREARRRP